MDSGVPKDDDGLCPRSLLEIRIGGSCGKFDFAAAKSVVESPPSSAFVSALQSPYISPRAMMPEGDPTPPLVASPLASSFHVGGSQLADEIPSSSYTPPSDNYEFSDDHFDRNLRFAALMPVTVPEAVVASRVSFSFPVPRVSLGKGGISPGHGNTKLRSCDVYVGYHGQDRNLVRFCKWVKSELELQGIACFVADRAKYSDAQSHEIADRVICSATFGIVVVTDRSFLNPLSSEEIRFFAQKKNLVPIFFEANPSNLVGVDSVCREAIDGLLKCHREFKLEASEGHWRGCIMRAARIMRSKLGRTSVAENESEPYEEIPFPRNRHFVGREREIMEIESILFGKGDPVERESTATGMKGDTLGQSEGLADEESDSTSTRRGVHKKSRSGNYRSFGSGAVCLCGVPGIGKTEIALEFAYRYSNRYKMVLWVGGESRYLRQNILSLSLNLGLDVSADAEKERGHIRSFDEQEFDAFKRVKRELFRDSPYLLIIDNLESEKDWWDGKDLHDLIPRNMGGSHVIITTRALKVANFEVVQVLPLPLPESVVLMKGTRRKEFSSEDLEVLRKFDEKLGGTTFGKWVVGLLLSELGSSPLALYGAVSEVPLDDGPCHTYLGMADEQYCKNNPFVKKLLYFCFNVLHQTNDRKNLAAWEMLLVGAWFAPAPVSASLLAAAAKNLADARNGLYNWSRLLPVGCFLGPQTWNSEEESVALLMRLGLAKRVNRHPGIWIQLQPIVRIFARRKDGLYGAKAFIRGLRRVGSLEINSDHLWASAFLVFGFKSEPPLVQLKPADMVLYIRRTALPLAVGAFANFSRCNAALELLKVCTDVLEEVEKSFVSQIQDWCEGSLCWRKSGGGQGKKGGKVDEYVWRDVTLLRAVLLETRARLMIRGGMFDGGEELSRSCISIRTVMLGHNHSQTLSAQETLAKVVRMRSKI
ncbi:hypothetical protein MLD38_034305 [Melastoma candidum]|uniref:Uncharacterized protein n=2 Tax=Melastoma candidum TaxID=119954 RepID=A0ACB9MAV9_9MYRT|nr:hypothetical protein MLD38_034305 [Melastoma candidum]